MTGLLTIRGWPGFNLNFGSYAQSQALFSILEKYDSVKFIDTNMDQDQFDEQKFDRLIIGGDQILQPMIFKQWFEKIIELSNKIQKIYTYSSSFGETHNFLQDKQFDTNYCNSRFLNFITRIQLPLSVREYQNVESLPNEQYIDPTCLLTVEEYKQKFEQYDHLKPNKFNFLYFVPSSKTDYDVPYDNIDVISYDKNKKLVNPLNLSFGNWLWLIANCNTFYTNSFHGFLFAVLFDKRIVNYNTNSIRIKTLIDFLNIKIDQNGCIQNHSEIMTNIEQQRKRSFKYIENIFNFAPIQISCYAKHKMIRDISTSGGFCGISANHILSKNGVVYGASYIDGFKHVKTIRVDNISDYFKNIAKSKYSYCQDCDFNLVKQDLQLEKTVLFIGCPCQIKRLKKFLDKDYSNLVTIDLKCHGYSNPKDLEDFINQIENENKSKVVHLDMRPDHKVLTHVIFENSISKTYNNVSSVFIHNNHLINECKICNMHWSNNVSDITVGDFWQFKSNLMDQNFSPNKGTNIININTHKGFKLFNEIKDSLEIMYL